MDSRHSGWDGFQNFVLNQMINVISGWKDFVVNFFCLFKECLCIIYILYKECNKIDRFITIIWINVTFASCFGYNCKQIWNLFLYTNIFFIFLYTFTCIHLAHFLVTYKDFVLIHGYKCFYVRKLQKHNFPLDFIVLKSQQGLVYFACTLCLVYKYTRLGLTFQWLFVLNQMINVIPAWKENNRQCEDHISVFRFSK